jgi:hypothetical protein
MCVLDFEVLASAESSGTQRPGRLLPRAGGIQTIFFPSFVTGPLVSSATCPVMFKPLPTSTFNATPPPLNFSPATEFAATFFLPEETTTA